MDRRRAKERAASPPKHLGKAPGRQPGENKTTTTPRWDGDVFAGLVDKQGGVA